MFKYYAKVAIVKNMMQIIFNFLNKLLARSSIIDSESKNPSRNIVRLISVVIPSIYMVRGKRIDLPPPLNKLVVGAAETLNLMEQDVLAAGGNLYLSDAFRTHDMQLQAHLDYVNKKKKSYSPLPGSSFHEAGRAIDIDVGNLGISLAEFWEIAGRYGWSPIIEGPNPRASECWHFDYREFWDIIVKYAGYKIAAKLAIMDIDIDCDPIWIIQGHLAIQKIYEGKIDGLYGPLTEKAILSFKHNNGLTIDTSYDPKFIEQLKLKTYDFWEKGVNNEEG